MGVVKTAFWWVALSVFVAKTALGQPLLLHTNIAALAPSHNRISELRVKRATGAQGESEARMSVRYSYNGLAGPAARITASIGRLGDRATANLFECDEATIARGSGRVTLSVRYNPGTGEAADRSLETDRIHILLIDSTGRVLARSPFIKRLKWRAPEPNPAIEPTTPSAVSARDAHSTSPGALDPEMEQAGSAAGLRLDSPNQAPVPTTDSSFSDPPSDRRMVRDRVTGNGSDSATSGAQIESHRPDPPEETAEISDPGSLSPSPRPAAIEPASDGGLDSETASPVVLNDETPFLAMHGESASARTAAETIVQSEHKVIEVAAAIPGDRATGSTDVSDRDPIPIQFAGSATNTEAEANPEFPGQSSRAGGSPDREAVSPPKPKSNPPPPPRQRSQSQSLSQSRSQSQPNPDRRALADETGTNSESKQDTKPSDDRAGTTIRSTIMENINSLINRIQNAGWETYAIAGILFAVYFLLVLVATWLRDRSLWKSLIFAVIAPVIGPILYIAWPGKSRRSRSRSYVPPPDVDASDPIYGSGIPEPKANEFPYTRIDVKETAIDRKVIENHFALFFRVRRSPSDENKRLAITVGNKEFVGKRITRISGEDIHLRLDNGHDRKIAYDEMRLIEIREAPGLTV